MRVTDVVNLYAGSEQIHSARQYLKKRFDGVVRESNFSSQFSHSP